MSEFPDSVEPVLEFVSNVLKDVASGNEGKWDDSIKRIIKEKHSKLDAHTTALVVNLPLLTNIKGRSRD